MARGLRGTGLTVLAASAIGLFVVGAHKNAQITSLRRHGVPVQFTVSKCLGLLAGSGSNGAGYSCRGTFVLDGRSFGATVLGNTIRAPGSTVQMVAAETDPGLVATVQQVDSEHASWKVFALPALLVVVLATALAIFSGKRVRRRSHLSNRALAFGDAFRGRLRGSDE